MPDTTIAPPVTPQQTPITPMDYSQATFNPAYQDKMPVIKNTIQQLRSQRISDDKIFSYLTSKGVLQMPQAPTPEPSYGQKVGSNLSDTFSQGGKSVMADVAPIAKTGSMNPLEGAATDLQAAGHVAGDIAGTAGNLIGSFITPLLPDSVKQGIGDVTKFVSDKVNSIPGMTPDIAKGLGDVFNTLTLKGGEAAEPAVKGVVEQGAKSVGETAGTTVGKVGELAGKVKEGIKPSLSPSEAVKQIIQGETTDLAPAQRSLGSLDTTGVKTYADLQSKLDSEIKVMSKVQDSTLGENKNVYKIQQLATKVGGVEAAHNYVNDAVSQLKEYYTKTNDIPKLQKINSFEAKIDSTNGNGLTLNEVNQIARMHGSDLNAFNANHELASGLSKKAAENTRMGLKNTIRNLMPDETSKNIDSKITDLLKTKSLIDGMVEKVNKAAQKTPKVGKVAKLAETGGKLVNTVTGGIPKAIGKAFGTAGSTSALSPVEIESNLAKNLKLLKGQ